MIIIDAELRRFVRKIVEVESPDIPVLSYQELTAELRIQPLGTVSMKMSQMPNIDEESGQTAAAKAAKQRA
ncbi:MAG TPA: hypothetical protein VK557_12845 [Pyrinomonadaceae bacterium]|nr:hypothetical protein [Pyrinomonadaceae bacterium]